MELISTNRKEVELDSLDFKTNIYTDFTNDTLTDFFRQAAANGFTYYFIKNYLSEHNLLDEANRRLKVDEEKPQSVIDWAFFPIKAHESSITELDADSELTPMEYFEIILYHHLIPEYEYYIREFYIDYII